MRMTMLSSCLLCVNVVMISPIALKCEFSAVTAFLSLLPVRAPVCVRTLCVIAFLRSLCFAGGYSLSLCEGLEASACQSDVCTFDSLKKLTTPYQVSEIAYHWVKGNK